MLNDFDTQVQIEEIIPEEYEDWLRSCAEAPEYDEENCFKPGRFFISMFELNP